MGEAVDDTADNMAPDGMRFQISVVDIKINPMKSVCNTHAQHCLPKEAEFEIV